jgi:hypothetical protein
MLVGPTIVGLVVITAAVIGVVASASPPARSSSESRGPGAPRVVPRAALSSAPTFNEVPGGDLGRATSRGNGAITEGDGALPDDASVFDDAYPGIVRLDADLLHALRVAGSQAFDDGIDLYINSGWRSADYQGELLRAAISEYGSEKEAARWVATAETSPHVSGDAVDMGGVDATVWLSEQGAAFGLCQIYRNEPWHFELRPRAIERGCPRMYPDPRHDPRMN